MSTTRYRSKKTGKVATYSKPNPRLDKSKDWERVEVAEPKKGTGKASGQ